MHARKKIPFNQKISFLNLRSKMIKNKHSLREYYSAFEHSYKCMTCKLLSIISLQNRHSPVRIFREFQLHNNKLAGWMDGGGFLNCSKIRPSCYVFEFTSLNSRYKLVVESLYGPCLEVEVKFLLGYQICKTCKWFLAWLFMKLQKSLSEQIVSKDMSNQFWIVAIWEKGFRIFIKNISEYNEEVLILLRNAYFGLQ